MKPSPEKTKHTVFGAGQEQMKLQLTFAGHPIAREESIGILGVSFGYAPDITDKWMTETEKKCKQGLGPIRGISHRLGGAGGSTANKLVMVPFTRSHVRQDSIKYAHVTKVNFEYLAPSHVEPC